MQSAMKRSIGVAGAVLLAMAAAATAAAAETRGYVVNLFVPAMNSKDGDCPQGMNPTAPAILERVLTEQGKPRSEIDKVLAPGVFNQRVFGEHATYRGRIDGREVNSYQHPLSVPDPNIKLAVIKEAYGFNLDGRTDAEDFTDPLTHETGVDNEAARVFGCIENRRGTLEEPTANWSVRWGYYNYGNTWLVEVRSSGDLQNADDAVVSFYRGMAPAIKNGTAFQSHITYDVDPDPRMQANHFKGRISNGQFLSEQPIDFFMLAFPRIPPEFNFRQARLRLSFKPDGRLEGFLGGFLPVTMVYFPFGDYAVGAEFNYGLDLPGLYRALRKRADSDLDADPKTGARRRISQTYLIRAVPAFLARAEPEAAAQMSGRAQRLRR